jgi:hypothetical protein
MIPTDRDSLQLETPKHIMETLEIRNKTPTEIPDDDTQELHQELPVELWLQILEQLAEVDWKSLLNLSTVNTSFASAVENIIWTCEKGVVVSTTHLKPFGLAVASAHRRNRLKRLLACADYCLVIHRLRHDPEDVDMSNPEVMANIAHCFEYLHKFHVWEDVIPAYASISEARLIASLWLPRLGPDCIELCLPETSGSRHLLISISDTHKRGGRGFLQAILENPHHKSIKKIVIGGLDKCDPFEIAFFLQEMCQLEEITFLGADNMIETWIAEIESCPALLKNLKGLHLKDCRNLTAIGMERLLQTFQIGNHNNAKLLHLTISKCALLTEFLPLLADNLGGNLLSLTLMFSAYSHDDTIWKRFTKVQYLDVMLPLNQDLSIATICKLPLKHLKLRCLGNRVVNPDLFPQTLESLFVSSEMTQTEFAHFWLPALVSRCPKLEWLALDFPDFVRLERRHLQSIRRRIHRGLQTFDDVFLDSRKHQSIFKTDLVGWSQRMAM